MSAWFRQLSSVAPPPPGLSEWAAAQPTYEDAWRHGTRADWLVWLAAATARSDEEKREIVSGACLLAEKDGILPHMFRITPNSVERAHLWASSSLFDDIDIVVADWFHGILLAAIVVVPLAVLMVLRSPSPGAPRSIFLSDLITIPLAIMLSIVGYVVLRRLRLRIARRSAAPDFATALSDALAALTRKTESLPRNRQESAAQTFQVRMNTFHRQGRAG